MAKAYDLTTLAALEAWVGSTSDTATLSALITQVSQIILNSLNRGSILPVSYQDTYDGHGGVRLFLKNWPVISINSLAIDGLAIPVSPPLVAGQTSVAGYILSTSSDPSPPGDQQEINLRWFQFCRGVQNVVLSYSAGYQISAEAQAIPGISPYTATPQAPYGAWASDQGVMLAGVAMTRVAISPIAGQYSVDVNGIYTFAAANAGQAVSISYGYIPADLSLVCLQVCGEIYAYKGRIGMTSKSLGGQETVSFNTGVIKTMVGDMESLRPYRRIVPL